MILMNLTISCVLDLIHKDTANSFIVLIYWQIDYNIVIALVAFIDNFLATFSFYYDLK